MTDKEKPPEEAQDQPKVFEISGDDLEELLAQKDEIEAAAEGKKKKRSSKKTKVKPTSEGIPEEVVAALRAKADERDSFLDKLQRVQAEYVNYQKRTKRERAEWTDRAVMDFLEGLLPLLDSFDGARRAGSTDDPEALAKGIEILRNHLWKILTDRGVAEIPSDGEAFDPKIHEAVAQEFSPDADDGVILQVFQAGYTYKEKVLRPTRVKIARQGEPPEGSPGASGPDGENPLLDEAEEKPHA